MSHDCYGMAAVMGIGDFVYSTVFISMLLRKYPNVCIDIGVKDFMIPVLRKWKLFRNVMPFGEIWSQSEKYKALFSGRHCYPLGEICKRGWLVPNRKDGKIPLYPVWKSNVDFLESKGFDGKDVYPFWLLDDKSVAIAKSRLSKCIRPIIGLHNSKGEEFWFRRKWGNKKFESLIRSVKGTWLQFGSIKGDWENACLHGATRVSTCGDLQVVAAMISCCDAFVSADTGLAAIAQALDVPTVLIMGPTDVLGQINGSIVKVKACDMQPCLYSAGDRTAEVRMLRCYGRTTPCMSRITPEQVKEALLNTKYLRKY